MSSTKVCIKCLEEKPISAFAFRKDTQCYRNDCKLCKQKYINEYRRENEDYKKRYNKYRQERRKVDEQFAMMDRMRARIRKCLKASNLEKYERTIEILGCSFENFKAYFESKFYGDMSWELMNFVIDHIIPISWFDLSDPKQLKYCFSYKNLQPLTEEDNAVKADKVWAKFDIKSNPYI